MGDLNPVFAEKLNIAFDRARSLFVELLDEAKELGHLPESIKSLNSYELSDHILGSWQGALLKAKVSKTGESLQTFEKMIFDVLLKN